MSDRLKEIRRRHEFTEAMWGANPQPLRNTDRGYLLEHITELEAKLAEEHDNAMDMVRDIKDLTRMLEAEQAKNVTEIIPDLENYPQWIRDAFDSGQLFTTLLTRLDYLEERVDALKLELAVQKQSVKDANLRSRSWT